MRRRRMRRYRPGKENSMMKLATVFGIILCAVVLGYLTARFAPAYGDGIDRATEDLTAAFLEKLPEIRAYVETDLQAAYDGDPAAKSYGEIISCYPAIKAIGNYRMAHKLIEIGVPLIPRIISF